MPISNAFDDTTTMLVVREAHFLTHSYENENRPILGLKLPRCCEEVSAVLVNILTGLDLMMTK